MATVTPVQGNLIPSQTYMQAKKPMHIKKNKKESLDIPEDRHPTSKRENVQ